MQIKLVCDCLLEGKSGFKGAIRSSLGWDRAIELRLCLCFLVCRMLAFRPGQNNCSLALAIIPFTPRSTECSASCTSALSCFGIRILSLDNTIGLLSARIVGLSQVVRGVTLGIRPVYMLLKFDTLHRWLWPPRFYHKLWLIVLVHARMRVWSMPAYSDRSAG